MAVVGVVDVEVIFDVDDDVCSVVDVDSSVVVGIVDDCEVVVVNMVVLVVAVCLESYKTLAFGSS